MSELLRVLTEDDVDDEALQEAAAAAHAVLETRGVDVEGVAPVLHEDAAAAGQQAIDDAIAHEPTCPDCRGRARVEIPQEETPVYECHDCGRRFQPGDDPHDDRDEPDLELILSTARGQTRRQRIRPNPDPGAAYLLTEASWTGCAWSHSGTEALRRVEIDGDVWHEADARDGVAETEAGP